MIVGNGVGARAAQAPAGCLSPSLSLLILLFIFLLFWIVGCNYASPKSEVNVWTLQLFLGVCVCLRERESELVLARVCAHNTLNWCRWSQKEKVFFFLRRRRLLLEKKGVCLFLLLPFLFACCSRACDVIRAAWDYIRTRTRTKGREEENK